MVVRSQVEDLEHLLLIGPGVRLDLLARQRLPRLGLPRRIADHAGEVADQEDDLVPARLELGQLPEDDVRDGGRVPTGPVRLMRSGRCFFALASSFLASSPARQDVDRPGLQPLQLLLHAQHGSCASCTRSMAVARPFPGSTSSSAPCTTRDPLPPRSVPASG